MIIQTVPNICEGRNLKLINRIIKEVKSIKNVVLQDVHYDYDHNRSVFTVVGSISGVFESIFTITKNCFNLDINVHQGVHPKAGIIDVIPFIPIKGISYDRLIKLVDKFAYKFFEKFKIPIYFYALSSKRPTTKVLSLIRNKGIEFIKRLTLNDKDYIPDIFKDYIYHPTMGVSFIGVRYPLIAFNFNLKINDQRENISKEDFLIKIKKIASKIRESNGGIKNLQALTFFLESKNIVQLSTNILEADKTNFLQIFEIILNKIKEEGLELDSTELVGCLPSKVIEQLVKKYLKIQNFSYSKIIDFKV